VISSKVCWFTLYDDGLHITGFFTSIKKYQAKPIPARICEDKNVAARGIAFQHIADLAP
jgi:hypothetical protein